MADGSVKIDVDVDDSNAKKKLDNIEDAAEDAGGGLKNLKDGAEDAEGGLDALDVAAGGLLSNGLSALIGGLKDTVTNIIALADETREYREDMAKLDTAFTTAGHSSETASKAYSSFYAILGESDRSVEAVNHLAELTKNEEEVAQWGTIAAGVTAKFGDSLPIEGLTEAANETAKVGQVTGPLADALNWAGISEEKFNKQLAKCNSEQERATLITNTLNKEYAAAAAEYNELTASQQAARLATSDLEQAQARMGEVIEPVTTAFTNLKTKALEAIMPVIEAVAQKIQEFSQWAEENPEKMSIITAAITAVAVALGVLAVALGISSAIQLVTAAFAALNLTMLSNPIVLIVAAIAGLVAAFLVLWNNCEGFRNFFIGLWESLKEALGPALTELKEAITGAFQEAWELIKAVWDIVQPYFSMVWENIKIVFSVVGTYLGGMFSTAWELIKAVWNNVTGYFTAIWETIKGIFAVVKAVLSGNWSDAWEAIKGIVSAWAKYFQGVWDGIKNVFSAVKSWFSSTFSAAWEGIKQIWSNVKQFFSETWEKIKSAFKFDDMLNIGKNIIEGLWNGINNMTDWIGGKIKSFCSNALGAIKDFFGIASPAKELVPVGQYIVAGLALGIDKHRQDAIASMEKLGEETLAAMDETAQAEIKAIEQKNKERKKAYDKADKELQKQRNKNNQDAIDAQREALKEQYELETEAINEELNLAKERQRAISSYANTFERQLADMAKIEENYAKNVEAVNKKLVDDTARAWDNYEKTVASRTTSIKNELGLFDMAEKGDKVSGKDLLKAAKSQVDVLEDYNTALETLSGKGVSQGFIDELKGMGLKALPQLEAINKMTDEQLAEYVSIWEEKNELAKNAALSELEPLKKETEENVAQLNVDTAAELDRLKEEYKTSMITLIGEIGTGMSEAGDAGLKVLGDKITSYVNIGQNLMEGLGEGISSAKDGVVQNVVDNVVAAIQAAKDAAGIHSPSRVMRDEVGKNLGLGLAEGWHRQLSNIKKSMSADMSKITASVRASVMAENARMGQHVSGPDNSMSDVIRAVGMQTAGINSLASEYKRGTNNTRPINIILDKRVVGTAMVDVLNAETIRAGVKAY